MGKKNKIISKLAECLTAIDTSIKEQARIAEATHKLVVENNRKIQLLITELEGGSEFHFKKMQSLITKVSASLENLDKAATNQAFGLQTALQIATSIEKNAESVIKAMKGGD